MESLRYYIAHNGGLNVLENRSGSMNTVGQFFEGKTLEHLIGCKNKPEVVFAAVAFDGGYRSEDAGKSWTKIMDGDVRTFTVDPHDERVVYMGIGPIRLFRSEDSGKTWEPLDGMLAIPDEAKKKWDVPPRLRGVEFPHVRHIFIHPDDQNLILCFARTWWRLVEQRSRQDLVRPQHRHQLRRHALHRKLSRQQRALLCVVGARLLPQR